jgi:hypothetical protein
LIVDILGRPIWWCEDGHGVAVIELWCATRSVCSRDFRMKKNECKYIINLSNWMGCYQWILNTPPIIYCWKDEVNRILQCHLRMGVSPRPLEMLGHFGNRPNFS